MSSTVRVYVARRIHTMNRSLPVATHVAIPPASATSATGYPARNNPRPRSRRPIVGQDAELGLGHEVL